jgi:hypothetical protein
LTGSLKNDKKYVSIIKGGFIMQGHTTDLTKNKPNNPLPCAKIKGKPCPHCHGTFYWQYPNGNECIRCKSFSSDPIPVTN